MEEINGKSVTIHTYLEQRNPQSDTQILKSQFTGRMSHRNGKTLLVYNETEEQVQTLMQLSADEVLIRRQGKGINSAMRFRTGVCVAAKYEVHGITLPMHVKTHSIADSLLPSDAAAANACPRTVHIGYDLLLNGDIASHNCLEIKIVGNP